MSIPLSCWIETRAFPDDSENAVLQFLAQVCGVAPDYVTVVAGVEVQFLDRAFPTCENHRQVKPMGKTSFVVNTASCPTLSLSKVSDDKP